MLFGINESLLDKLESVLRTATCLVLQKRKFDLISTDICHALHWLPIRQRISSKSASLSADVYTVPDYIAEMLTPAADVPALQRLRFATLGTLVPPMTVGELYGPRSFRSPLQNSRTPFPHILGLQIQHWLCLKNQLKTNLFARAIGHMSVRCEVRT